MVVLQGGFAGTIVAGQHNGQRLILFLERSLDSGIDRFGCHFTFTKTPLLLNQPRVVWEPTLRTIKVVSAVSAE
jgi:hypothetical protein